MSSINWENVKLGVEIAFYGLSAAGIIWQSASGFRSLHSKLDAILGTQKRQQKQLTRLQLAMGAVWRAVRRLSGRVESIENRATQGPVIETDLRPDGSYAARPFYTPDPPAMGG